MTELGIPFKERTVKFDSEDWDQNISRLSPTRFVTYDVILEGEVHDYQQALLNTRAMKAWTEQALTETEFVPMDEPYVSGVDNTTEKIE